MRIAVRDHQNKSTGLVSEIVRDERLTLIEFGQAADILLIDHDVTPYYRNIIDAYHGHGAKVLLYPHGATAHLAWDGVWPECSKVSGFLAMSEGQRLVMQKYGFTKPVHVTDWHWCEIKPFEGAVGNNVLFAPIHALSNGFIHPDIKHLNTLVFETLCKMSVNLKVRYVGELEHCGIDPNVNNVHYKKGGADNSIGDIDKADYVVSFGTFAYLAVARGKPTIMYRQDIPYFDGHAAAEIREAEHWHNYEDYMRYPLDIPAEEDLFMLANKEHIIKTWRRLHIGDQMKPGVLGDILIQEYQK